MTDFQHWNFVNNFTAEQAAALILGFDPANLNDTDRSKIAPVISCMQGCYREAFNYYIENYSRPIEIISEENEGKTTVLTLEPAPACEFSQATAPKEKLYSVSMQLALDANVNIESWISRKEITDFESQQFTRWELDRWLREMDLDSKYPFRNKLAKTTDKVEKIGHWPWGDHTTGYLEHLEAAALEFWAGYNGDPKTAAKNETVITWLKKERGLSQSKAEAIATILRAEGIPAGPRKKN
ncbi:hypothetical protein NH8B_1049 [Pseudogulbenkiania sp. NH8B]|uniref:hypothetical protein n=1 Tax=Pseudogulbenkiania sp. (strain NH8B) TaxID=748280 RepID=UPI0002279B8C|nr:hypothetical protein [Pseudogulbenkiania sp. NH8B]BAK75881.1 hypothetical protein NH8B_1049 [Pseudogulbenkiania sp. NH8B]